MRRELNLTVKNADAWERLPDGRIKITLTLERNGAKPVFLFDADSSLP